MKKESKIIIILLFLLVCVLIFPVICGDSDIPNPLSFLIPDQTAEKWNGDQELPQSGKNEEVLIPGFESLVCYADQHSQKVNLYNPAENNYLLKMTMFADGDELWQSGYIEPGKGFYNVEFNKTLEVGKYNGILLVECFLNDGTNGEMASFRNGETSSTIRRNGQMEMDARAGSYSGKANFSVRLETLRQ